MPRLPAASPFHELRGHVAREGAATVLPAVRGVILPIDPSTGGAVTAAGGFFGEWIVQSVPDHAAGSNL